MEPRLRHQPCPFGRLQQELAPARLRPEAKKRGRVTKRWARGTARSAWAQKARVPTPVCPSRSRARRRPVQSAAQTTAENPAREGALGRIAMQPDAVGSGALLETARRVGSDKTTESRTACVG